LKYDRDGNVKTVNKKTTTQYNAKYPALFIEHCKQGKTTVEFCAEMGICRDTFDEWSSRYPDMGHAKKMGKLAAEAWYLEQARNNLVSYEDSAQLDTTLYKFIVGGRFGHTSKRRPKFEIDVTQLVESLQSLAKSCAKGDIDVNDFAKLSDGLVKAATLQQHETMSKDIEGLKLIAEKNQSARIGDTEEDF
jgi:hypothetical protein